MWGTARAWVGGLILLAHLAAIPGGYVAFQIGRPRFFAVFLTLLLALLLFDWLSLVNRGRDKEEFSSPTRSERFLTDWRFVGSTLLVSVGVLVVFGRGSAFYLAMGLTFSVLILRMLTTDFTDPSQASASFDLLLVTAASFTLIGAHVFTVEYFYGVSDTIVHTALITEIVKTGSVEALSDTRYFWYSVFHVYSSVGTTLTALSPRTTAAIVVGVLFEAAVVALYLFFRGVTESRAVALLSATMVTLNIAFMGYGVQAHYQSLSFVLFAFFLYLLFTRLALSRTILVLLSLFLTWTATHHVSLLMGLALTAVPVGAWSLMARRDVTVGDPLGLQSHLRNPLIPFLACGIIFSTYWVFVTAQVQGTISWIFFSSSAAQGDVSTYYDAVRITEFGSLLSSSVPFFVDTTHFGLLLALAGLGILPMVRRGPENRWYLLTFLPAAFLYFPNPLWVPFEGLLEFSRWRIMTLPFLVVIPAIGLMRYVDRSSTDRARRTLALVFVFLFVLTTLSSAMINPSLVNVMGYEKDHQRYITGDEIEASGFVEQYRSGQPVQAYSELPLYMQLRDGIPDTGNPRSRSETYDRIRVDARTGQFVLDDGLTIMSSDAIDTHGIRVDVTDRSEPGANGDLLGTGVVYGSTVQWDSDRHNVVYANDGVVVAHT